MSSHENLIVTLQEGIKRVVFNAPERRNAVDVPMIERFLEVVRETASDSSRVLVLTGA
jgi:enoyl-CoA hydratase/carnithine racemase